METRRIFTGSFIRHQDLYDLFESVKNRMNDTAKIKWTRSPENLHLTWHFFGDRSLQDINRIEEVVKNSFSDNQAIDFTIDKLGYFNRKGKPAVLYAGVTDSSGKLQDLYQKIQKELYKAGLIDQVNKRFVPHITLGRIKKVSPEFYEQIQKINAEIQPIPVKNIKVENIESILSPQGALYQTFKK